MFVIICDIDNCYTDSRDWIKFAPTAEQCKDKTIARSLWDKYQSFSFLAKPNRSVIDLVCSICELVPIYFVTSREDRKDSREDTIRQIEKFSDGKITIGEVHKLFMRSEFDYRPSAEVKRDIVTDIIKSGNMPVLAIDDDLSNCEMFVSMCIPTKKYDIETDTFEKFFVPDVN